MGKYYCNYCGLSSDDPNVFHQKGDLFICNDCLAGGDETVCPYCHVEVTLNDETDEYISYFCCKCKSLIIVKDMTDESVCEGGEDNV